MLQNRLFRCLLVLPFCCAFLLTGCGKKGVTVKGTVVLPQGVKLVDTDAALITFHPEEKGAKTSAGKIQPDGSFVATDVYPAKSKISLTLTAYPGLPESKKRDEVFAEINKAFGTTSPLTHEVTSDTEQTITVDFNERKVTKK